MNACPQCHTPTRNSDLCENCQQWIRIERALKAYCEGLANAPIWHEPSPQNRTEQPVPRDAA